MPDLHERLRIATASLHDALERQPYFRALHAGTLPKPAIVSFLRCLSIIHAVLERSLSQLSHGPPAELARSTWPKVELLAADLEALDADDIPSITPAIRAALDYGAEILTSAGDPSSLVGVLYVLEGSQNGGVVLQQAYARCLGVAELSYVGCYKRATAAHWRSFVDLLNALGFDDDRVERVTRAAITCFERLASICAALYPYESAALKYHVAAVNCEAGDHAMPQKPLEIALALRAGRAAWEKYPYLEARFGERGRRFTSSDSCWLVALCRMPVVSATKSLEWLRTVLSSRGIPTVILQTHLAAISEAMAQELAEHVALRARYEPFLANCDAERRALRDPEGSTQLIDRFERRLRTCTGSKVDAAAQLVASAWFDERAGITGALAATQSWLVDPSRFSGDWIAALSELVARLEEGAVRLC